MLIVLHKKNDTELLVHIQELLKKKYNCDSHTIGTNNRVIAVPGDTSSIDIDLFKTMEGVQAVDRVSRPYKLASRHQKDRTEIVVPLPKGGDVTIGSRDNMVMIAGPCSVESETQLDETAAYVKECGVHILRGGAFKPRSGPYAFQGLGEKGLKLLRKIADKYDMAVDTEAMNEGQIDMVSEYADIIQIGARNMQNYDLLRKAGTCKKPILLKNGLAATHEEWLLAAEYILAGGNPNVMLCERGIRTHEEEVRFTLRLASIPALRELTHLPIIIDPSHAAGTARWVSRIAQSAVAIGCDGLIIETHPRPEEALSDGPQSLNPQQWSECMEDLTKITNAIGKTIM